MTHKQMEEIDDILIAFVALIRHDLASDERDKLPHCVELQHAIETLRDQVAPYCGYEDLVYFDLISIL